MPACCHSHISHGKTKPIAENYPKARKSKGNRRLDPRSRGNGQYPYKYVTVKASLSDGQRPCASNASATSLEASLLRAWYKALFQASSLALILACLFTRILIKSGWKLSRCLYFTAKWIAVRPRSSATFTSAACWINRWATSTWTSPAAKCSAVHPLRSLAFTLALVFKSSWTISKCPRPTARFRAVFLSFGVASAPKWIKWYAMSIWLSWIAISNGVFPCLSSGDRSISVIERYSKISHCRYWMQWWNGVRPILSAASMSAEIASNWTRVKSPVATAMCRAVSPSLSALSIGVPLETNVWTHFRCPLKVARWSGVWPSSSLAFKFAWYLSSMSMISSYPFAAAKCKGVRQQENWLFGDSPSDRSLCTLEAAPASAALCTSREVRFGIDTSTDVVRKVLSLCRLRTNLASFRWTESQRLYLTIIWQLYDNYMTIIYRTYYIYIYVYMCMIVYVCMIFMNLHV